MYSFHNFFKKTSSPPSLPQPTIPKPLDDLQITLVNDGVKILLLEKKVADLEDKIAVLEGQ